MNEKYEARAGKLKYSVMLPSNCFLFSYEFPTLEVSPSFEIKIGGNSKIIFSFPYRTLVITYN